MPEPGPDLEAARVALLALRTQFTSVRSPSEYLFPPSSQPVFFDEAAKVLSDASKPIICSARFLTDRVVIDCVKVSRSPQPDAAAAVAAQHRVWEELLAGRCGRGSVGACVLLRRQEETLRVSIEGFLRWTRDYRIAHTTVVRDEPLPDGVCLVMEVLPHAVMRIDERGERMEPRS